MSWKGKDISRSEKKAVWHAGPIFLVLTLGQLFCTYANAQDDAKKPAEDHFYKGLGLYQAGKYDKALAEFEESFRIRRHWKLRFNVGMCHYVLNHEAEAAQHLSAFLDEGKDGIPHKQKKKAWEIVAKLKKKLGTVQLVGEIGKSMVLIDGKVKEGVEINKDIFLAPGKHVFTLVIGKTAIIEEKINLKAGESKELRVNVVQGKTDEELIFPEMDQDEIDNAQGGKESAVPGGGPSGTTSKTWKAAWATLGVGAALFFACAVTGGLTLQEEQRMRDAEDDYMKGFDSGMSDAELEALMDKRNNHYYTGKDLALAADTLLGLGTAFIASMAVLFIVSSVSKKEHGTLASPGIIVGPGSLEIQLQF